MEGWVHPLREWREKEGLTLDAAAAGVGTVRQIWYDWEIERRLPSRNFMPKLYAFTRGAITPDMMHFPRGYPDIDTPRLPFDNKPQSPAPLLDGDETVREPERLVA